MTDGGVTSKLNGWMYHPFTEDMDVMHWALLTVLIVSVAFFWTRILHHITE